MHAFHKHLARDGFRLRGLEVSRIDAFSDVVFGFAVTLLVVSLEVPKNYGELHKLMTGFFPFAVCFLLLMLVWHTHYKFFRRFGLQDTFTIWLNGALLFFVLFYTYPLKFLFQAVFNQNAVLSSVYDIRELTLLYAGGFCAIYLLVAALYANAWRLRAPLELTRLERRLTGLYFFDEVCLALIGLAACVVAMLLPPAKSTQATMLFMLIAITKTVFGRLIGKAHRQFGLAEPADNMNPDA